MPPKGKTSCQALATGVQVYANSIWDERGIFVLLNIILCRKPTDGVHVTDTALATAIEVQTDARHRHQTQPIAAKGRREAPK